MPRWKALPNELDPRVAEFVGQLRLLVDRSGLGIAAVADRTGYSKASWERYLSAGLLAPKGAVVALAEVTGASPVHLVTMWELAERTWSRSEMFGTEPEDARPAGAGAGAGAGVGVGSREGVARRKRGPVLPVAGVVGVLVLVAAVVYFTRGGGEQDVAGTPKTPVVSASPRLDLPPGVKCRGASCAGKDPETMGCGGRFATTATSVTVGGALVEVRYSETCGAAWARVTRAGVGDRVEVSAGGGGSASASASAKQTAVVGTDVDTYTPMVAVKDAGDVRACVTLGSGQAGCTA
ncbi:XRE family transcriptional regulator [Streptomyces sp. NPDC059371]|uniref:XRE family transcriptional regulator n=1 Tax=Streptomyces sp. NPDC059371 TaxID=3346812 RepID=UPI0036C83A77